MKNNKAWVSWHAARARAARATITQQTLHSTRMGMQRTARGPLRVPPSLNTDSTSCEAPRGTCSHPAPSRHAHPTLPLVPLPASSVYICALLYTWLHASGDPCSPSTGCCLALPTQAAQPVPRGTCSHSAPSLSASLEDTLDPACSVISALLYTLLCAPRPIHRLLSCRAHVAPTQLPVHSLKHFPPLC